MIIIGILMIHFGTEKSNYLSFQSDVNRKGYNRIFSIKTMACFKE